MHSGRWRYKVLSEDIGMNIFEIRNRSTAPTGKLEITSEQGCCIDETTSLEKLLSSDLQTLPGQPLE
jgi:hypothetical protein